MQKFKLPPEKALTPELIDSWCRELTDMTGLAFAAWDGEGRFWMPVGFSTTLNGLIMGSEALRDAVAEAAARAFESDQPRVDALCQGVSLAAIPIRRRRRTVAVVTTAVLSTRDGLAETAGYLALAAAVAPDEVRQRLTGEHECDLLNLTALARLAARLASEYVQRTEVENEVASVSSKLSEGYEEITLYQRMASKIRVSQPSEAFFLTVCGELLEFLDVEGLAALCQETGNEKAEPRVVTIGQVPLDQAGLLRLYHCYERDLMDGREAIIANECPSRPEMAKLAPGVRSMMMVPLRQGNRLYGIMAAFNKRDSDEFISTDVKLVASVSGTIAVFVENSHLYADLHELMLGTIKALVSSIDAKDQYTRGHSERVALISKRLATQMKLAAEDVERIYLSGLLHDIGKIGVPESILLKTGRLAPEEFAVMRTHTTVGARILAGVRQLESVIPGVLHHHERLDGRGYPMGLNDSNMPIEGRIIGLADSLDAMTSNRVYRAAMPMAAVEAEIRRCTGSQFDVRCVDALAEIGIQALLDSLPVAQSGPMVGVSPALERS